MNLKIGHIYWFRYNGTKKKIHDPQPMVLVLWPGRQSDWSHAKEIELMHGINLNYLEPMMTDDLVKMISMIAAGRMSGSNTFKLYHDYMKRHLSPVIYSGYRTYDPDMMRSVKEVSHGFEETTRVLDSLKRKVGTLPAQQEVQVQKLITSKLNAAKMVQKIVSNVHAVTTSRLSDAEAEQKAIEYMAAVVKAKKPVTFNKSLMTLLQGRKIDI